MKPLPKKPIPAQPLFERIKRNRRASNYYTELLSRNPGMSNEEAQRITAAFMKGKW